MGIGPHTLQLFKTLQDKDIFSIQSVIELGSQDISCTKEQVSSLLHVSMDIPKHQEGSPKRISAKKLYDLLGCDVYACIDLDGAHGALAFNLNHSLKRKYGYKEQFAMVTNFGTAEHVFNQYSLFENIHELCAPNGIMVHGLPIGGYRSHGFFNYQPTLFGYLALANNYRLEGIWYVQDSNLAELSCLDRNREGDQYMYVVLRKQHDRKFCMPIQGNLGNVKMSKSFPLMKTNRGIGIFGAGNKGQFILDICHKNAIDVRFFVDEFKTGFIKDIPIITLDAFLQRQSEIEWMFYGVNTPHLLSKRCDITVPILDIF